MIPDLAAERQRVLRMIEGTTPELTIRVDMDSDVDDVDFPTKEYSWVQWLQLSTGAVLNLEHGELSEADAALIAQAPALARSYAEALGELARLREALEWYGEQARLCRLIHSAGDAGRHALSADGGKRAAAALAPAPEERP